MGADPLTAWLAFITTNLPRFAPEAAALLLWSPGAFALQLFVIHDFPGTTITAAFAQPLRT